ncbi:hypothetical protein FIU86_09065 [Roseovarius sp. THAF9]|uniref:hypothetical protein n=1 Tax=Roseovarius sp. THAF9 TaxID=2587847 RepID=UPI0012693A15|nr:hypothetical protein [Roseovarius sp. THAF9]QFT92993.1 hypothetical protein FIU86_09065 [Roseovarius sp. THAF9]
MLDHLRNFLTDDTGVVSVDWIVLGFSLICLGCLTVGTARDGTFGLADSIKTSVESKTVEGVDP